MPKKAAPKLSKTGIWPNHDKFDLPTKPVLTNLVDLAIALFDVPTAAISLFSENRQHFKAAQGIGSLRQLASPNSFCLLALKNTGNDVVEIRDAPQDPQYAAHPMVTGGLQIRFYAGTKLTSTDGKMLGSFFIVDQRPRTLSPLEKLLFQRLAEVVNQWYGMAGADHFYNQLGRLMEQSDDGLCILDGESLKFEYANPQAQIYLGRPLAELKTLSPKDLQPANAFVSFQEAIKPLYSKEKQIVSIETVGQRKDGSSFPVETSLQLWHEGKTPKLFANFKDISHRKEIESVLAGRERHLLAILDAIPECIKLISPDGRLVDMSPAGLKMLEANNLDEVKEKSLIEYVKPQYRQAFRDLHERVFQGRSGTLEFEVTGRKGSERFLETKAVPLRDADGDIVYLLGATRDITERKAAETALFQEKEMAQVTLKSIGDAVITVDKEGIITYLNPVAEILTGWKNTQAKGQSLSKVLHTYNGSTREPKAISLYEALQENKRVGLSSNTLLLNRHGVEMTIEDSAAPIHDQNGHVVGGVLVFRDVGETRDMAIRMTHLAQHDFLTDLPNRVLLHDRLERALAFAARNHNCVALLFIDLDRFKQVNDSLGHGTGDQLLVEIANRLKACVRQSDTICRQGGDEFVAVLDNISDTNHVAHIAEKLREACSQPCLINNQEINVSISIGISLFPFDGDDVDTLSRNADAAMYHAKSLGRNNFQFYTPAMNARARDDLVMENDLRRALRKNEFVLYYQPIFDLASNRIIACEALIRWHDPKRGLVQPNDFLPYAEGNGLIVPISQWALFEACRQNQDWQDKGYDPIQVAVNLSSAQFKRQDFLSSVEDALLETQLDPQYLELELTETIAMSDAEASKDLLLNLKDMGVKLAIDDFGTGYSSLSYLRQFPIDKLKIDQSFVRDLTTNTNDAAITSAIISMAKSLHQEVVAEGVENKEQLRFLHNQGCDAIQGFYFHPPLPADDFVHLMAKH